MACKNFHTRKYTIRKVKREGGKRYVQTYESGKCQYVEMFKDSLQVSKKRQANRKIELKIYKSNSQNLSKQITKIL